jgi:hypothetical protein
MRTLFVIDDHTGPFSPDGPSVSDKSITFEKDYSITFNEDDKVQIDGVIYRVKTILKKPIEYGFSERDEPVQMVVLLSRIIPGFSEEFETLKNLAEAA